MSFDSLLYLLFLPAVALVHWLTPSRLRWAVLLGASYVFYIRWNAALSLLILFITGCSWMTGRLLEKTESPRLRKLLLLGALAVCLGLLAYFKYFNLLGRTAAALLGGEWRAMDIVLPVGVSFYTFQALSYVIDVYRRSMRAERHFGYYALYVSFFPQLVAGPIERASDLLGQLRKERRFERSDLSAGLRLLISGYFRKIVIADMAAPFVNAVFAASRPDGSAVLAAALLFGVQIYCDFSGYSEIAMGSARLMGIRLTRNFDRPYGAANIREFWRRWHISLTRWFTDYVYIPLGGSRAGLRRQIMAATVVFALCGLWHGAAWSYVLWGLLHACFLNLYTVRKRFWPALPSGRWEQALTYAAVSFSWLFFRAGDTGRALLLTERLFSAWDFSSGARLLAGAAPRGASPAALLLLLAGGLLTLRRLPALTQDEKAPVSEAAWAGLLLAIGIGALIRLDSGAASAFIYFQF